MENKAFSLTGKQVLVTGGTGSIGKEIVRQILKQDPKVIRVYSRDESKQFDLQHELSGYGYKVRFLIGDVRDSDRIRYAMDDIDVVFHAGALKHVPSCEFNPFEAIKTNVIGTQNVIEASLEQNVERVIAISTDKAVSPTNTMGATKLLAEKLISSANLYKGNRRTVLSCVRFGNVMGSRGSVIPLFVQKVLEQKPVGITDREMKRFMMSIPDAVRLVLRAGEVAEGGETFILKMPVFRIEDVAKEIVRMVCKYTGLPPVPIHIIGMRSGEKVKENLIGEEESARSYELGDLFVLKPDWHQGAYGWESTALKRSPTVYDTNSDMPSNAEQVRTHIRQVVEDVLAQRVIVQKGSLAL